MELMFACLLLAASVSASPLTDQRSRSEVTVKHNTVSSTLESDTMVVDSSPAFVFVGAQNKLLRCRYDDPNDCEVWFEEARSSPGSLLVVGEYIYAGVYSGVILKCELYQKKCETFYTGKIPVESLVVKNLYLYAGCYDDLGTILRCQVHEPNSCSPFHHVNSPVFSLINHNDKLIAGLRDGRVMHCSVDEENSCTLLYKKNSATMGITSVQNNVITVTYNGWLYNCSRSNFGMENCENKTTNTSSTRDLTHFNGALYIPEQNNKITVCKDRLTDITDCSDYGNFTTPWSIAFAYAANHMQRRYSDESKLCTWQGASVCPPFVTYYDAQERAAFEVHVFEGKLYNTRGFLVDTADASEGDSGPAAIFVMSPDGTILLSNRHERELLHTSSLLAGGPASGAGEMVVNKGKIEKITTCSAHYLPDLNLNRQVIESLRVKGYTGSIELQLCEETTTSQPILNEIVDNEILRP